LGTSSLADELSALAVGTFVAALTKAAAISGIMSIERFI
jgi:hypothetical protein